MTGIILAGGKGTRMGSEKGLIIYNNKPLIVYAIEALTPICDEILISANSDAYHKFGYQVIPDQFPDSGPMGGIYSCLQLSGSDVNIILSCDMPLVKTIHLQQLIKFAHLFEAVIPWHGNEYFEPLCAVYRRDLIPVFERFVNAGNFKIPDLIGEIDAKLLKSGGDNGLPADIFFNVNSRDQLRVLEAEIPIPYNNPNKLDILHNLLLIAGTGRKVGKTTLACQLINKQSKTHAVTGIKISPHMHHQVEGQSIVAQSENYMIIEETNFNSAKDSSRMLKAGASRVFYLQTRDRHIIEPFQLLLDMIPENAPVICESGTMLKFAKSGLFFLVSRINEISTKEGLDKIGYKPDIQVIFNGTSFDFNTDRVHFKHHIWSIIPLKQ